ncbi:MAG: copper resistance protein B [Myxococcota bacterium]
MIPLFAMAAQAVEPAHPGWKLPINDRHMRGMLLVDQLEYRLPSTPGAVGTDLEGWMGGDVHRLRYRGEGTVELGDRVGEGELGAAYSRLVGPWVELQLGAGLEAQNEVGSGFEARLEVGVEAVIPYDFDLEALLRVSHRGRVSARVTAIKELMLSQRLILQLRAEATGAVQESVELDRAQGLENATAGLRLRYEVRREFAPYLGGSWTGGFEGPSGTGRFVQSGSAAAGVRVWF